MGAEVLIVALSIAIGTYSALHQYSFADHLITGLSFVGYSMPIFWWALLLIILFSGQLGWTSWMAPNWAVEKGGYRKDARFDLAKRFGHG